MEAIVIGSKEAAGRLWVAFHCWQQSHNYIHGELVSSSHPLVPDEEPTVVTVIKLNQRISDVSSIVEAMARAAGVKYYRAISPN